MAAATKVTLFFNQYRSGWSETYYSTDPNPSSVAAAIPNSFYQAAANFRSGTTILQSVRFSRVDGSKASFLVNPLPIAQGKSGITSEPGPDVASTTSVYRLLAQNGATRRVFVRGLADIDTTRDVFGNDLESPDLVKGRNKFFKALFDNQLQIRWVPKPPAIGVWTKISLISQQLPFPVWPGVSWLTVALPNPAWAVGDKITFNGITPNLILFPRTATIQQISPGVNGNAYLISYNAPGGFPINPKNLRATTFTASYSPITQWFFERFSEHKTGRPFGSLRGRRRAVSSVR